MKMKKALSLTVTAMMALSLLYGCTPAKDSSKGESGDKGTQDKVSISFPTSWVGVNVDKPWFQERLKAFEKKYGDKITVNVEEIAGDQAYIDKMKVLYSSNALPDVISTGGYNLIDSMKDQLTDLTPYVDQAWKETAPQMCWDANTRDGKIYGIPYTRQVIGYFYNKDLFAKAGIDKPADTWDEFFAQCDKLKKANITPLSMDTADSGWVTSLMLGAIVGESEAGEKFMNTNLPKNYNTPEFIDAAKKIQTMFQKYTTPDAVGGKYENAASNFFMGETAIIANGPWMVRDFYDTTMVDKGFADKIGTAMYPGGVMYDSGKIGFNIASRDKKKTEAAVQFVKFMTSEESQKRMLEMTGDTPASESVKSDNVKPLVSEVVENGNKAKRKINDFQSLWYANVVDEISIQYPLLAQGKITPQQFAQALTDAAGKN